MKFRRVWNGYLGEVPEGSGADAEVRFWKVSVQRLGQVLEASGAHTQARFRKVPVQRSRLSEVLQGSGADTYFLGVLPAAPGKKVKELQAVGDST